MKIQNYKILFEIILIGLLSSFLASFASNLSFKDKIFCYFFKEFIVKVENLFVALGDIPFESIFIKLFYKTWCFSSLFFLPDAQ